MCDLRYLWFMQCHTPDYSM